MDGRRVCDLAMCEHILDWISIYKKKLRGKNREYDYTDMTYYNMVCFENNKVVLKNSLQLSMLFIKNMINII